MTEIKTGSPIRRMERGLNYVRNPKAEKPLSQIVSNLQLGDNLEQFLGRKAPMTAFETPHVRNISRGEALDLLVGSGRLLIYPATAKDTQDYEALKLHDIPQFERFDYPQNPDITLVQIPLNAWRLDSIDYQEELPIFPAGNGAIEIMNELGNLLNDIKHKTGMLPNNFQLCKAAFVAGQKDFIMLVPPYRLAPDVDPKTLIERLRNDLDSIDTVNKHDTQIEAFSTALLKNV